MISTGRSKYCWGIDCSCYPNGMKCIECTICCHCCTRNDNDDNIVLDRKLAKQKMRKKIARNEFYNFFHSILPIVISATFVNSIIGGVGEEQSNSIIHLICGKNGHALMTLQILFMVLTYVIGLYFYANIEDTLVRNFLLKDSGVSSSGDSAIKIVNCLKFKTATSDESIAHLLLFIQRLVASIAGFTIKSVMVVLLFRVYYYRQSNQLGVTFGMYCVFLAVISVIILFCYYIIGRNIIKNTIEFNGEAFSLAIGFCLMLFFSLAVEFPCGEYLYYWKHDQESHHNIDCGGYNSLSNFGFASILSLIFTGLKLGFHYCFKTQSDRKIESSSTGSESILSSAPAATGSTINSEDELVNRETAAAHLQHRQTGNITTCYSELIEKTLCYILSIAFLGAIFSIISVSNSTSKLISLTIIISFMLVKIPQLIASCNVRMIKWEDNVGDSTCKCYVSLNRYSTDLCCPVIIRQLYDELIKERRYFMVIVFRLLVGLLFEDFIIVFISIMFGEENMRNQAGGCSFELVISVLLFVFGIYYTPIIYEKQVILQQEIIKDPLFSNLTTTKLLALHKTSRSTGDGSSSSL